MDSSLTFARVVFVHLDEISVDFSAASRATADIFSDIVAEFLNASSITFVSTGNAPIMSLNMAEKS